MKKAGLLILAMALLSASHTLDAQDKGRSGIFEYVIVGRDTIYVDEIEASRIYPRRYMMKGKSWRQYYKLVYNFNKVYPYALVARKIVADTDSYIEENRLKGAKREKYISGKEKELFNVFEKPLRHLTVTQGRILMKLIDREVGKSSYLIIRDYTNRVAAAFWQGVAKLFGSDLKKPYDPEGEDSVIEELVQIWESGNFDNFYFSLFLEYPAKVEIPEEYLTQDRNPLSRR
ncbi:MAG: DUF4294 domain-containing protein [Bacteroidales bacterium]|nr:DUF4294 domain-containing protein [Bacteroidales bacterium]